MKVNVFLKIDRIDVSGYLCLRFWLETFRKYNTFILCDRNEHFNDLASISADYPDAQLIQSDRSVIGECCSTLKPSKRNMASANLTGFKLSQDADAFWMIDADDTMFLTRRFDVLEDKFREAERVFEEQKFDAFSLDFYRNLNDGWTFGVALMRSNLPYQRIMEVKGEDMVNLGYARNIDSAFHVLGDRGIIKRGNFVFNKMAFQHLHNNYPLMPEGVYYWSAKHLWDVPLQSDVISI